MEMNATDAFWGFVLGTVEVRTHSKESCIAPCPIHQPSDHKMKDWPKTYRADKNLIERECEHGIGHPDPDSVKYLVDTTKQTWYGIHGCDGCCSS